MIHDYLGPLHTYGSSGIEAPPLDSGQMCVGHDPRKEASRDRGDCDDRMINRRKRAMSQR